LVLKYKNGENVSDSVGLLISMLVRYPEIGTINFDPETNNLKITFMMLKLIPEPVLEKFRANLLSCLETFHYLALQKAKTLDVKYSFCEDITLLEYKRDISSLTSEEISLTIALVRESFAEYLLTDKETEIEEDQMFQEEQIGKMLENVRYTVPDKKLIAFREEGRVLIFNK